MSTYATPQVYLTLDPQTHEIVIETFRNGIRNKIFSGKESSLLMFNIREELEAQAENIRLQQENDKRIEKEALDKRHKYIYTSVSTKFGNEFAKKTIGNPPEETLKEKRMRIADSLSDKIDFSQIIF
jgi:DNA repair exonuclease SbcCD nuclease subunit